MLRGLKRLNRYEKRMLKIASRDHSLVRLKQLGFSRRTREDFRFPIYALEIGKPAAFRRAVCAMVAGVHGLETIAIRVLLDFLDNLWKPEGDKLLQELRRGRMGLVALPVLNPSGLVLHRRSNAAGVDLMRNSGVDAKRAMPFFGGHKLSDSLPYYRGKARQPESRLLMRFMRQYCFNLENRIIPVLDIHSGFGRANQVWWPPAGSHEAAPDDALFRRVAFHLQSARGHQDYQYEPQNLAYTMHGDLWDWVYESFRQERVQAKRKGSRLLPYTLELGTWAHLREQPRRLLARRKIFNPPREHKQRAIREHRLFLRDFARLALSSPADWVDAPLGHLPGSP